ncbi:uncharacterized protein N7529_010744 [Penicillium soppii]|uniref:uncharacterized protein n=1 Tax=Penicillium soppii TaxID=69789 RepID=UPI002548780D|nr:uncharacterized protein N7529_010744 [Penicillium soppii]KAJ5851359.1 hypothetical protein N7529_010744 [Penicillium soppii]
MYLTTIFTGLTMILAVTAIPVAHEKPSPTPSMSKALISPSSASASASASASPTPSPNPFEAYTCPKGKYKSCCMSVQETGHSVIQPLGELVPMVGGLQLSSAISFQCKKMAEREAPATCHGHGYSPMCCDSKDNGLVSVCKSFEETKENYYSHQGKMEETQADMIMDAVT